MKIIQDKDRGEVAVLENDSHYSKWVENHKSLCTDKTVPDHLLPLIPLGGTVVDVGANIGTHTVQYAERVGSKGKVFAFEPYKPSFDCLRFNCKYLPQVKCHNMALGWMKGHVKILKPSDNNMGAVAVEWCEEGNVAVMPLDYLKLKRCDFIKIDAEGFEVLVLFGAAATIGQFHPFVYVELNDGALARMGRTKQDVLGFMEIRNYEVKFLAPEHNLKMSQVDILFVPK